MRGNATASAVEVQAATDTNREEYLSDAQFGLLMPEPGAEVTLKRFWKTVGVERRGNEFSITLDKRPLKTPSGNMLLLPEDKRMVATLVATEWENQETLLKPHALPMVSRLSLGRMHSQDIVRTDFYCCEGHRCPQRRKHAV
jgi:chaperone required for assembly of F1-ATPase